MLCVNVAKIIFLLLPLQVFALSLSEKVGQLLIVNFYVNYLIFTFVQLRNSSCWFPQLLLNLFEVCLSVYLYGEAADFIHVYESLEITYNSCAIHEKRSLKCECKICLVE